MDWLTKEQRSRNMSAIKSRGSASERRVGEALRLAYPRRKIVEHPADVPGKPDYYLPGLKLAVFVDGCFWHGCPKDGHIPEDNRDYWEPKLRRNRERDRIATRTLRKQGICALRVWEHDVRRKDVLDVSRSLSRRAARLTSRSRSSAGGTRG